ncbi:MAG: hypothetical protein FJ083_12905 [Cyanobacteria bacterium K_Offshore_surface_m2_239]|nr:hypothetical protein [Cyanobacteria bacterium K_Offshore_surface_m2_239]
MKASRHSRHWCETKGLGEARCLLKPSASLIRPLRVKGQNAALAAVVADWQASAAGESGQIDEASAEKKLIARHFAAFSMEMPLILQLAGSHPAANLCSRPSTDAGSGFQFHAPTPGQLRKPTKTNNGFSNSGQ